MFEKVEYLPLAYLLLDVSVSFPVAATAELLGDHLGHPGFVLIAQHRHIIHRGLKVEHLSVYDLIKIGHHEHAHHSVAVENV